MTLISIRIVVFESFYAKNNCDKLTIDLLAEDFKTFYIMLILKKEYDNDHYPQSTSFIIFASV